MTILDQGQFVKETILKMKGAPGPLIEVLHKIQGEFGYVSPELVTIIAEYLNLSRAEVHGVISFYHFFRSTPPGSHIVKICRAEACQAMGARQLEEHAKRSLRIGFHETTSDGCITLEPVYCLGNCACAPAIRINDEIHANVNAENFDRLTEKLTHKKLEVRD